MTVSIIGITDEQVVDYQWNGTESMSWTLVESSQQRQQDGAYALVSTAVGTSVEFSLTIDPKIPLPGFLVKKAQKMAVETASKGLAAFVAKTV